MESGWPHALSLGFTRRRHFSLRLRPGNRSARTARIVRRSPAAVGPSRWRRDRRGRLLLGMWHFRWANQSLRSNRQIDRLCRDADHAPDDAMLWRARWADDVRDVAARDAHTCRAREDPAGRRRLHVRTRRARCAGRVLQRMTAMTKVALSGASGNMGKVLRVELQKRGVDLRSAGGRTPLTPLHEGEDVMHGDLRDPAVVD